MKTQATKFLILLLTTVLAACASGTNRLGNSENTNYQYGGQKFSAINISLDPNAREQLKDNLKFDPTKLEQTLTRAFQSRGLIDDKSENVVNVLITDIRTRSNFSAVMFGFMAGNDHVVGKVSLLPRNGGHSWLDFQVSASYALGGLGGGQDEARMSWLYEEFAKLTLKEILGEKNKD